MGFLQSLVRMFKGEPVFQVEPTEKDDRAAEAIVEPAPDNAPPDDPYVDGGKKVVPEVKCEQVEWRESGENHREVWASISNDGELPAMLDKMIIFGQTMELDHHLQPGQGRDFCVYRGARLTNQSHSRAELYFRLPNGDYFCSDHQIFYQIGNDSEIEVKALRLIRPIRDV